MLARGAFGVNGWIDGFLVLFDDGRTAPATAARPSRVEFDRTKYGRELLIDAATIAQMPGFITSDRPHVLMFHDILLVTKGRGRVLLDGESHDVAPGVVVFSLPGQIREWRVASRLDGACLFFAEAFVVDTFSDPRFLEQFAFFRAVAAGRNTAARTGASAARSTKALPPCSARSRGWIGTPTSRCARGSTGCWCCSTAGMPINTANPRTNRPTSSSSGFAGWSTGTLRAAIGWPTMPIGWAFRRDISTRCAGGTREAAPARSSARAS